MGLRTVEQLKAARACVGWKQQELAAASGVSLPTIKRLEGLAGPLKLRLETLEALEQALKDEGVTFLADGEPSVGHGVSYKDRE